ncbi:hypothetical protein OKW40_001108 [Paraburkholderia sp. RAU6.4a]|uniref:endonuclease/exonuclease/phosphatase family protein n=1 Tax=Paraburkholderia sp. RAU6.4a TaxID=2991067 RepID=UPI003D2522BD
MDLVSVSRLGFLWWNTGLTPPVIKLKATSEDREFAVAQITDMRRVLDFGILGLCEVQTSDLDAIMDGLDDPNLRVIDKTDRSGKQKFDIALIYDETRVTHVESCSFVERFGKHKFKLGEMMTFVTTGTNVVVRVVLSHWPSRRTLHEKDPNRTRLGSLLCDSLAKVREDPETFLVLMGDYNDDPCSPSLSEYLLATRDRELAKRDHRFFYNPFWRWLGESLPSPVATDGSSICGTHYYRGGDHTEWFTYDQIIFTSAFLNRPDVVLEEELTQIVVTPELAARLRSRNVCDHFPVTSTVKFRMRAPS